MSSQPRSRSTSQIIDADLALLLQEFRTPKTIVEAVISYSHAKKADPEQILDEAFPVIMRPFQKGENSSLGETVLPY
jgi:hypothetical protein